MISTMVLGYGIQLRQASASFHDLWNTLPEKVVGHALLYGPEEKPSQTTDMPTLSIFGRWRIPGTVILSLDGFTSDVFHRAGCHRA